MAGNARRGGQGFELAMMSPALILLAAISFIPLFTMIWMSLSKVGLIGGLSFDFIGLDNWRHLFTDPDIGSSWILSLIYFAATVGAEMVLGTLMALLIHSLIKGRNFVLSLVLIPMFIAPIIVGLLGRFLLDPSFGLYSWFLSATGLYDGNILGSVGPALAAVIALDIWEWSPLVALIVLAGLTAVPTDILEAAEVDGASYRHKLVSIILPSILPILLVALLIRAMDAIRFFAIIFITTNGGPADSTKIIPIRLYDIAFRFFDLGYASAVGLTMLVFSIVIATVFVRVLQRKEAVV
ncbi:carbohydrate ABC transporter permease [Salinisphaera hydrothermalis]|uniref:Binding-protein-dependent transport system inner membrane protein n=1 Tax=Salinisphaera hydrothermalis (strain C41B8) TaxID=1304275 RepID=A0A084IHV5_SALHC|nr:sugar ABC transporter permease [Salinisphaera hydrothermalis]KEZ76289.1 binding-protein-dependent transport system inner membrane protein [Salinisphaera hydrothermalis C41B8]